MELIFPGNTIWVGQWGWCICIHELLQALVLQEAVHSDVFATMHSALWLATESSDKAETHSLSVKI